MKDSWDIEETSSNNGIKGGHHYKEKTSAINTMDNCIIKPDGFGVRHFQTFLMFLLLVVAFMLRLNLPLAIFAMTDNRDNPNIKTYKWDFTSQIILLTGFMYGYILPQIPAGVICRKYGPKIPLMGAILLCAVLSLVTPAGAAGGSWPLVCGFSIVQGLTQSFIMPGVHTLLSKWAPSDERGRLTTYAYAGAHAGTILMLIVSVLLIKTSIGWPCIFYVSGGVAILWVVLYFIFGCNSPADCHKISLLEKQYIEASLGTGNEDSNKLDTPWKKIFTSVPFYALIIAHCAQNWGFFTMFINMPSYMKHILNFDIKENVILSMLPYLLILIFSIGYCIIGDKMIKDGYTRTTTSRKIFNSIGNYGAMLALIGLAYVNKEYTVLAVILLTIAIGVNSATCVGFMVNHMDISTNFAGTLMGITNCFACIVGIFGPAIIRFVLHGTETDPAYWQINYLITAGVFFIGNTVFILFGSGDKQSWNNPTTN